MSQDARIREVEEIIKESKLYQGFQCDDYIIRLGLMKRLATAIVSAQDKREKGLREVWEKFKPTENELVYHAEKTMWQAINNYFGGE